MPLGECFILGTVLRPPGYEEVHCGRVSSTQRTTPLPSFAVGRARATRRQVRGDGTRKEIPFGLVLPFFSRAGMLEAGSWRGWATALDIDVRSL